MAFADALIRYSFRQTELELECRNLFNTKRYVSTLYSEMGTYINRYELRPLSFLLKIRFNIRQLFSIGPLIRCNARPYAQGDGVVFERRDHHRRQESPREDYRTANIHFPLRNIISSKYPSESFDSKIFFISLPYLRIIQPPTRQAIKTYHVLNRDCREMSRIS